MGKKYLIDSNSIIDFFNGKLPQTGRDLLLEAEPFISIVTYIEIFSGKNIAEEEYQKLQKFAGVAVIYPVILPVATAVIELRKTYSVKLPDAIIAATALYYGLTLITRNVSDFKNIKGLDVINPHEL